VIFGLKGEQGKSSQSSPRKSLRKLHKTADLFCDGHSNGLGRKTYGSPIGTVNVVMARGAGAAASPLSIR
jgi:hypothetical protein